MTERPITVVVVDDHTIVREGLISLLNSRPGIRVVGEAGGGLAAMEAARSVRPDVVILDLSLPDVSGIDVIYDLAREVPSARVVVLSMHDEPEYVRPALKAGVAGYLVKGSDIGDLVKAVECAMRGSAFLSPCIAKVMLDTSEPSGLEALTERELEVLRLVAGGKTSREVGRILGISPKTVDNHRQSIMQKLGIHDVVSLTRLAIRSGLVSPE